MIERLTGDSQMDVEDGFRALLEKIIEHSQKGEGHRTVVSVKEQQHARKALQIQRKG
jgi:hypothetical protein